MADPMKKAKAQVPGSSEKDEAPKSPNHVFYTMDEVYKDAEDRRKNSVKKHKIDDMTDNSGEANS